MVTKVSLIRDLFYKESRGFGFIEITNHKEAERARRSLDGKSFLGSHGGRLGWKK